MDLSGLTVNGATVITLTMGCTSKGSGPLDDEVIPAEANTGSSANSGNGGAGRILQLWIGRWGK